VRCLKRRGWVIDLEVKGRLVIDEDEQKVWAFDLFSHDWGSD
jgi:hypothetical protein